MVPPQKKHLHPLDSPPLTPVPLTPKEQKVLQFIRSYSEEHGFPPTYAEIQEEFQYKALSSAQQFIEQLVAKGYLEIPLGENKKRALKVIPPLHDSPGRTPEALVSIPLEGSVAAGTLKHSYQNRDTVEVPRYLLKSSQDYFALKVTGDSMIEDCIMDGDLVIIKRQHHAMNGQTVVALVNDETTIKRFYKKKSSIELHPANPNYSIIHVESSAEFKILGILASVIRTCD